MSVPAITYIHSGRTVISRIDPEVLEPASIHSPRGNRRLGISICSARARSVRKCSAFVHISRVTGPHNLSRLRNPSNSAPCHATWPNCLRVPGHSSFRSSSEGNSSMSCSRFDPPKFGKSSPQTLVLGSQSRQLKAAVPVLIVNAESVNRIFSRTTWHFELTASSHAWRCCFTHTPSAESI
jgi:hypothetical protein